jgi:hypothetical protein
VKIAGEYFNGPQPFWGIDSTVFDEAHLVRLGGTVLLCAVDEADGYRSLMAPTIAIPTTCAAARWPLAEPVYVIVTEVPDDPNGFTLVDADDGHLWLECFTDNVDDWYPAAVFRFHPKEPK